jgi:putative transcriptional regulator
MPQVVVALFAADETPKEAAFQVLPGTYLTMHPRNIEMLLARRGARVKLFAGFSGWAPRQLEAEMAGGSWYALRATDAVLFRTDTSALWRELVDQASGPRTGIDPATEVAAR